MSRWHGMSRRSQPFGIETESDFLATFSDSGLLKIYAVHSKHNNTPFRALEPHVLI